MAAFRRLALLAAGAGAVWYAKQKLSEDGSGAPPRQAQGPPRTEPDPVDPPIETTAFQEPEVEPVAPEPPAEEPPPAAFEDQRQEGWHDEQVGADPKAVDELEIDPATAPDADQDVALEAAEEVEEPAHDTSVSHPRTEPAHVTRVVDDLLEGRRDEAEEADIEDATLVDESAPHRPERGSS